MIVTLIDALSETPRLSVTTTVTLYVRGADDAG